MSNPYDGVVVCRGCWSLGTACGKCQKCIDTKPAFEASKKKQSSKIENKERLSLRDMPGNDIKVLIGLPFSEIQKYDVVAKEWQSFSTKPHFCDGWIYRQKPTPMTANKLYEMLNEKIHDGYFDTDQENFLFKVMMAIKQLPDYDKEA